MGAGEKSSQQRLTHRAENSKRCWVKIKTGRLPFHIWRAKTRRQDLRWQIIERRECRWRARRCLLTSFALLVWGNEDRMKEAFG